MLHVLNKPHPIPTEHCQARIYTNSLSRPSKVQLWPEELGRWRTPAWTFCHNPQTDAPWAGRWSRNRCRHRRSGRWGNLADPYTGQPASWCGPKPGPLFPCRWCSDRGRSCWRRPLCRWWVARGGRVVGTGLSEPRLEKERKNEKSHVRINYCWLRISAWNSTWKRYGSEHGSQKTLKAEEHGQRALTAIKHI